MSSMKLEGGGVELDRRSDLSRIQLSYESGRNRWCCRGLSMKYASCLIGIVEAIFLFFLALQLPEFLMKDGYLFYTTRLAGNGVYIFVIGESLVVVSFAIIVCFEWGLKKENHRLLVPHMLWQLVMVVLCMAQVYLVIVLMENEEMLKPAAGVLIFLFGSIGCFECWWFCVICDCYRDFRRLRNFQMRTYSVQELDVMRPMIPSIQVQKPSTIVQKRQQPLGADKCFGSASNVTEMRKDESDAKTITGCNSH